MPPLAQVRALEAVVRDVARTITLPFYLNTVRGKKADGSALTAADEQTQEALIARLPDIAHAPVLGEEMTEAEQNALWAGSTDGLWVIDPIDGTTNFANGIPLFALAVAYMVNGKTQFGVVYNPITDEAFFGARGSGAWLNGDRLPLRQAAGSLAEAVAGADFKRVPASLAMRLVTQPPCFSLRNFGSSALEWCYVAAGRLDVYLHGGQMLWDHAVGQLLVEESGGLASSLDGSPIRPALSAKQAVVVAATPELHRQWLHWLNLET